MFLAQVFIFNCNVDKEAKCMSANATGTQERNSTRLCVRKERMNGESKLCVEKCKALSRERVESVSS